MSLELISEVWDALRSHLPMNERKDAASTLVDLLIDWDYDAAEIKESFRGDKDVAAAVQVHSDQYEDDLSDEDLFGEDTDDDDW